MLSSAPYSTKGGDGMVQVTFLPDNITITVAPGTTLLQAQIAAGLRPDAPCGGRGTCGKCRVEVAGETVLACRTLVQEDMTVVLPEKQAVTILTQGHCEERRADGSHALAAAFDIGTTTLVSFLLDGKTGALLATASAMNPQFQYGADVIARIEAAMAHPKPVLQQCLLPALSELLYELTPTPEDITLVSIVGNTAMHHLLLAIDPKPLVTPPYMPRVREALVLPAAPRLPIHPDGVLRILPNIAGFVGADTVGCMTAVDFGSVEELTLMIDIGTNGEMVLGTKDRRIACSTAAGPAFEGAKISMGMRGSTGAIDHVWIEKGQLRHHVIGETTARGICGSGLLDAVACLLELEIIDESGYLEGKQYTIPGTCVTLTQADIREVQLAKAAIRAGIELMCVHLGVTPADIRSVLLAGAFGNYLDPRSACRIGMIPPVLLDRIRPIGNAAGEGAQICAVSAAAYEYSKKLAAETEFLELASRPEFQDCFVDALEFCEEDNL